MSCLPCPPASLVDDKPLAAPFKALIERTGGPWLLILIDGEPALAAVVQKAAPRLRKGGDCRGIDSRPAAAAAAATSAMPPVGRCRLRAAVCWRLL